MWSLLACCPLVISLSPPSRARTRVLIKRRHRRRAWLFARCVFLSTSAIKQENIETKNEEEEECMTQRYNKRRKSTYDVQRGRTEWGVITSLKKAFYQSWWLIDESFFKNNFYVLQPPLSLVCVSGPTFTSRFHAYQHRQGAVISQNKLPHIILLLYDKTQWNNPRKIKND